MSTLQTKLGSDPTFPWVPWLRKDIDGNWYCSPTKEDLEILWRQDNKCDMYAAYSLSDAIDYYIMRDERRTYGYEV